jgi:hypothetical protein
VVKQPVLEADNLSPSGAEVKNTWRDTSTSPYVFIAWSSVKHRDFVFVFIILLFCPCVSYGLFPSGFQSNILYMYIDLSLT